MPVTTPIILFGKNALEISGDVSLSTLIAGGVQPFSIISTMGKLISTENHYATYEPDFWLLDGNYKFMAAAVPDMGYMSTAMSGAGVGDFAASVPLIRFSFNAVHNTPGLTLRFAPFSGDWADSITIAFYDAASVLIRTDTYNPTSANFSTGQAVTAFKRVDISFNSTNKPFRYARLELIKFDNLVTFSGAEIKKAMVVEEIDPISLEMPVNTIEFSLHSDDGNFSIVAPAGFYASLAINEPVEAYEMVDGSLILMGRFYLDDWESISEHEARFHARDLLGVLGEIPCPAIDLFVTVIDNFGNTIPAKIASTGVGTSSIVSVDAGLSSKRIYGANPPTNYRDYIQHFCLSVGGYATCARSRVIQVRTTEIASTLSVFDFTLTGAQKSLVSPISLLKLITGVEAVSHTYVASASTVAEPVFDDDLALGVHTILYGKLIYGQTWTPSGGLIGTASILNSYEVRTVTTAGHLVITGKPRVDNKKTFSLYNGSLPVGTPPNIIRVEDVLTINPANAAAVVQLIYDYSLQRYSVKTTLFASPVVAVGDSVYMDVQSGGHLKGIIERMETDMARGFVSKITAVGVLA